MRQFFNAKKALPNASDGKKVGNAENGPFATSLLSPKVAPKKEITKQVNLKKTRRFGGLLRELSPKGLAEKGIPFTGYLRMPKSVLLASVIINLAGLALPLVILQVYDRIIPNQALETFFFLMVGLCAVVLFEGLLRMARSFVISWRATRFTQKITEDIISRYLYANNSAFAGVAQAKMIEKISNINRIAEFYGGQSRLMFIDLPFAFIFLGVMSLIGGWLVAVPFFILCIFGVATVFSSHQYRKTLEEKEEHEARTYDFVAESIQGITTMKCQSAEPFFTRRFERLQAKNAQLHYLVIVSAMMGQSIASLLGNGTMIAMVTTGSVMAVFGDISVGVLACCSLLSGRAVQPILRVANTWNDFQRARLSVDEIAKLFELEDTATFSKIEKEAPIPHISAQGLCIDIGAQLPKLVDINVTIKAGEVVALMGPDDSGKSSLLDVLIGLARPQSGEVTMENVSAYDFRCQYQSAIGVFKGDSNVFKGTIFENLSLFGHGASAENVRWAADILDIQREIDKLPEGYDTMLGTGITETLPIVFIQLLLMARLLAQKPVVWALHNPIANLDNHGKKAFMNALENVRGWQTIIFTTNDDNLAQTADKIFYVQNGHLTQYHSIADMKAELAKKDFDHLELTEDGEIILSAKG